MKKQNISIQEARLQLQALKDASICTSKIDRAYYDNLTYFLQEYAIIGNLHCARYFEFTKRNLKKEKLESAELEHFIKLIDNIDAFLYKQHLFQMILGWSITIGLSYILAILIF